jgi:hypothetical protein
MYLNFYDKLFFAFYDMMRRQGNINPKDDKIDGLVGGSIFMSLIPLFLFFDISIIFKRLGIFPVYISKSPVIIGLCIIMALNILYFRHKKRYLNIENEFKSMPKKKRRINLLVTWTIVFLLIASVFISLNL